MYKRFFRWASDRLDDDGIVAFITNRAYLDARQDDGFRKIAAREFSEIYVLDLGSDVRRNPTISGTTHNVFGIQTGVAIGFFVRNRSRLGKCAIYYSHRVDAELASENLAYLRGATLDQIAFEEISPDENHDWLNQSDTDFARLLLLANRTTKHAKTDGDQQAIFALFSNGINTNRDEWLFDFNVSNLSEKVQFFCSVYRNERCRFTDKPDNIAVSDWVDRSI